jgi:Xanthosine triphosphate pyrophosphatase
MDIFFISSNPYKINEVKSILNSNKITVNGINKKIHEIQSEDMIEIVVDKAIKAFYEIGRPIIVEQTGLLLKDFANLPGGLTQIFWDSLKADNFCKYFSNTETAKVCAKTVLAYCDGKKIHSFEGSIEGTIVKEPRGDRAFQWDCVFQPNGYSQTFAELGQKKNEISMRRAALEKLKLFLEETSND